MSVKFSEHLRNTVMYFTHQECEKRAYKRYEINRQKLEDLSIRELQAKFIRLKASHEIKKSWISFIVVILGFSILTGIWSTFYKSFQKLLNLYLNQEISVDVIKLILISNIFILVILVTTMVLCISIYFKNRCKEHEQLMLIEEVKSEKLKNSENLKELTNS